jgi:PD-(D/E)XK nuclease superfamily
MKDKLSDLLTDIDFERIEMSLKEPNIFKALAVERMELKHSNFIGYLLNPAASHGLNSIFLKKILRDIYSDLKADQRSIFDVDEINLNYIEIRREWRNIDILIILSDDVVVIENKIDSMDHLSQLKRYKVIIDENFPNKKKHYVFLTPFGVDPNDIDSKNNYINYSYFQISEILLSVLGIYKNNLSDKVFNYISDYKKTIDMELLMSDELNNIALRLYNSHKDALDFIFENRPDPATILYPHFENEIKRRGYYIGSKNKGCVRFTTEQLNKVVPKTGKGWPGKESFLFEIDYYWSAKYAIVNAVISPCDEILREMILSAVKESKFYKKTNGKKWLVFYKMKRPFVAEEIAKEDDDDEIKNKIAFILDEVEPVIKDFVEKIENAFKDKESIIKY